MAVSSAHPETLLYDYLTAPRAIAPRWYHEGSAVFMETWMRGGVGRAQGGYDEMVFRAMVQDGAKFYDPLGLVSKGTVIDFQTGANAYLYGTRFMDYLAFTYGPQSPAPLVAARCRQPPLLRRPVPARLSACRSMSPGSGGSTSSTSFSARTFRPCASTP